MSERSGRSPSRARRRAAVATPPADGPRHAASLSGRAPDFGGTAILLRWPWDGEDLYDRVPRVFRYGVAAVVGIWFLLDNLDGFSYRAPLGRALDIATGLVVLGAICFIWLMRSSAMLRGRLGFNVLLGAAAITTLLLQPGNEMGQVAAFAAIIVASGSGALGVPVAMVVAGFYTAAIARSVHAVSPTLTLGVAGGAAMSVIGAYLLALWSRYIWSMRADAAATRERQRLAREMHDVLAHTLSGLTVQLEATRLLAERRSGDPTVVEAVADSHRLARDGLLEARRAVSALRGDGTPGVGQLERLVREFEVQGGVRCRLEVEGTPVALRPDTQLALYRTAQEALTNVRKHADATSVVVRLVWERRSAELTVENEGRAKPSLAFSGYGLTGIRERAELVGGSLEAGPTDAGFRVRLRVPA